MTQDVTKVLRIFIFSDFFIIILVYAFLRSYDLIFGVKIKNVNIIDGANIVDSVLRVTGKAKNATELILNGRVISIDQSGNFSETVALLSGYNLINIKSKDKFGHRDEKSYQLILE